MVRNIFTFVFVIAAASGVLASPVKRCPPGLNCGVGPECTIYDCSTEDCASAPVCQKRDLASPVKRCPPGINCGVGPECTIYDCNTEDCASAPVCQKRDPTPVHHPCPDICNEEGVCGCALESSLAKVKRDPTPAVNHPCPMICNEHGVCGCALESSTAKA